MTRCAFSSEKISVRSEKVKEVGSPIAPAAFYPWKPTTKREQMPQVEISEDTMAKVRAFRKVVDAVIGEEEKLEQDSEYVEMITLVGLDRMLQDTLPKEEPIGLKAMTIMFSRNPQFVSDFVVEMIQLGARVKEEEEAERAKEKIEELRTNWAHYVV